ncbi:hypothetical protein [Actinomadura xylanilytica]|uniref:hypothetical protein n=1 Tax=Actinomadura xylanilytica TaxID=887459 RepID=UPI00255ACA62|nr:hypothetical protein [Actinomadura xylanilytica]MDL4770703.1 hypothetical protein [Actinomadura xylanilytica]
MIEPADVPNGGFTNMCWPEDPYGSGQTSRTKRRLLTSTATCSARDSDGRSVPVSYAVVYLRLHRSKAENASNRMKLGFRALAALTPDETAELVRLADLDLLRARRLAQFLIGYGLLPDLDVLRAASTAVRPDAPRGDNEFGRGVHALIAEWPHRSGRLRGETTFVDAAHDLPGDGLSSTDTEHLQRQAKAAGLTLGYFSRTIKPHLTLDTLTGQCGHRRVTLEWLAVCAVERALASALIAARHLGLYEWPQDLDVGVVLETNAGDCFPTQRFHSMASP